MTPPVLLGQTGACAVTLAPTETADATISAVGPAGPCWTVKLGRVDDIVQVDGAWIWWHDGATLTYCVAPDGYLVEVSCPRAR